MKLFVANCSRQAHNFNYKLPEKSQPFCVKINSGAQHMFEYPPEAIDSIIQQHEPYGLQPRNKVDRHFSGLCYSIDRPISANEIINGSEQKLENLGNMSQEILKASAVAMNQAVESAVAQSGETPMDEGIQLEIKGEAINQDQDSPLSINKKIQVKK